MLRKVVEETQDRRLIGALPYCPLLSVAPCRAILSAFGADPGPGDEDRLRPILEQSIRAARSAYGLPTLIIDDAHHLDDDRLQAIFDIAGFSNGPEGALFKVVLVGSSELAKRMQKTSAEYIGPSFSLEPMSEKDTADYIRHRLAVSSYKAMPFSDDALEAIYGFTGGNPLKTNMVCMFALDDFRGRKVAQIDAHLVKKCFAPAREALGIAIDESAAVLTVPQPDPLWVERSAAGNQPDPETKTGEFERSGRRGAATTTDDHRDDHPPMGDGGTSSEASDVSTQAGKQLSEIGEDESPNRLETASDVSFNLHPDLNEEVPKFQSSRRVEALSGPASAAPQPPAEGPDDPFHSRSSNTAGLTKESGAGSAGVPSPSSDDEVSSSASDLPKRRRGLRPFMVFAVLTSLAVLTSTLVMGYHPGARSDVDDSEAAKPASIAQADTLSNTMQAAFLNNETIALAQSSGVQIDMVAARKVDALRRIVEPLPELPEEQFRKAVTIAGQYPEAAASAYALAANADHERAAYYLGQMFEIGEGVPIDFVQARAWYQRASSRIDAAKRRLAGLPVDKDTSPLAPPVPLYSRMAANGEFEMVWTSGNGADPKGYAVEFAKPDGEILRRIDGLVTTVLRSPLPETASYWRISTVGGPKTGWLPIDSGRLVPQAAPLTDETPASQ